jgi:L-2-hydroxyglutarate oxidase
MPPVVIGGGIVGLATALAMAERGQPPIVLEAERRIASHQTGHNSGVIHSGLYYKPGSLKAALCREGLNAMYAFCESEDIPHRRCGKLVVATNDEELPRLSLLEERGRANGVRMRRVTSAEIRDREPAVTGIAGLWVSDTGVVNYSLVADAIARKVTRLGGDVRVNHRVVGIRRDGRGAFAVESEQGVVKASQIINCAGLQSDRIARLTGENPDVRIVPFRGEYYLLKAGSAHLVRGLVYPVPDPSLPFLGVHFTRGIDDVVEAGPNAVLALKREGYAWQDVSLDDVVDLASFPGFWKMARHHWRTGVAEVKRSLSRRRFLDSLRVLVPALTDDDIERGGSGVRAQAVDAQGRLIDDFHILARPGIIHVLNSPSPAATAALAIGRRIAALSQDTQSAAA